MGFKILIAIAAHFGWQLNHVDRLVGTQFLNTTFKEIIYIELPKPLPYQHPDDCNILLKTHYGLKRSPREWYSLLYNMLSTCLGLCRCHHGYTFI